MLHSASKRAISTLRNFFTPPIGCNLFFDLKTRLPNEELSIIFDVGANTGQSAVQIRKAFPKATVYSFEPITEFYLKLAGTAAAIGNVRVFNFGLSNQTKTVHFTTSGTRSHIDDNGLMEARLERLDEFCTSNSITHIDLLKIDTEGHDLDVLKGGALLLQAHAINVVLAECGVNADNDFHAPFFAVHQLMESHGYRLFGLYEQIPEWPTRKPNLRRVNAAYISPAVINRN